MSHLDEQIAEALTHGPDTLTYILAQEVTRLRAIPADRVLGEGLVAVDREDVRLAIKELDLLWPCDRVKRMRGRFFDALRANQGGASK